MSALISWIRRTSVSTLWVWLWCFLSPQTVLLKFNVMVFGSVNYLIAQWLSLILIVILCFYAVNVRGTSLFSLHFGRNAIMTWSWACPFCLVSLAQRKPNNLFSLFPTAGLGENRVSLRTSKSSLLYTENKIKVFFCNIVRIWSNSWCVGSSSAGSLKVGSSQTCPM